MHVITRSRLRHFAEDYPDAKEPLDVWYHLMKRARYQTPHDVREDFGSADFLSKGRVVFDIGGNKYRLVVKIEYKWGKVFIRHVVTHKEYDRLTKSGDL
jgi:mRNA interferase HigB